MVDFEIESLTYNVFIYEDKWTFFGVKLMVCVPVKIYT